MTNYRLSDLSNIGNALAYYQDSTGTYKTEYFCVPRNPEAALTDPFWRIMKMDTDKVTGDLAPGKSITFANGTPEFVHVATDLATVSWFTYL